MSRVLIECEVLAGVNVSCLRGDGSICQVAGATKKQYPKPAPAYQDTIPKTMMHLQETMHLKDPFKIGFYFKIYLLYFILFCIQSVTWSVVFLQKCHPVFQSLRVLIHTVDGRNPAPPGINYLSTGAGIPESAVPFSSQGICLYVIPEVVELISSLCCVKLFGGINLEQRRNSGCFFFFGSPRKHI